MLDADYSYPADSLTQAWQLVCLNQFHDIIPGSSIGQVYSDSLAQYEKVRQIGERVKSEALTGIRPYLKTEWLVVNPTAFTQSQLVFWPETFEPDQQIISSDDRPVAMQAVEGGMLLFIESLPPLSVTSLQTMRGDAPFIITRINSMEDTPLTSLWLAEKQSLIAADRENIVIETIKWAENGDGLIVRLYESQRQRGDITLSASFPIARAEIVNLLEETQEELAHADQQVTLPVKPYQIVTLRIVPGGAE